MVAMWMKQPAGFVCGLDGFWKAAKLYILNLSRKLSKSSENHLKPSKQALKPSNLKKQLTLKPAKNRLKPPKKPFKTQSRAKLQAASRCF